MFRNSHKLQRLNYRRRWKAVRKDLSANHVHHEDSSDTGTDSNSEQFDPNTDTSFPENLTLDGEQISNRVQVTNVIPVADSRRTPSCNFSTY